MSADEIKITPDYVKRLQFYEDTVACKKTDRVLVSPFVALLPINLYGGVTVQEVMENYSAARDVFLRFHEEYQPDLGQGPQSLFASRALDVLGCKYVRWPGKHFDDPNQSFQVLDEEWMLQEEYDEYIEDPTGFMLRKLLPRQYGNLKGLEMLDLSNTVWHGALYSMIPFALPPVQGAVKAMAAAGGIMMDMSGQSAEFTKMLIEAGWPMYLDYAAAAPFDIFNDTLRGLINTTMDMIEVPDKLLAALDVCTRIQVRQLKAHMARFPTKTVCFFIHNGMDDFMSREQFETFYWPGLKAVVEAVVEMGGIARIYTESNYESKLDILATLPHGKTIIHFIGTDMHKVREAMGGKICYSGGIDGTLLQFGTPEEVEKNVRDALDICASSGGYIVDTSVSLDVAKPENLHALFDTAKNYTIK